VPNALGPELSRSNSGRGLCSASNPIYQEGSSRLKFDGSLPTEIDLSPQKRGEAGSVPSLSSRILEVTLAHPY
jgi:hypothetical protein